MCHVAPGTGSIGTKRRRLTRHTMVPHADAGASARTLHGSIAGQVLRRDSDYYAFRGRCAAALWPSRRHARSAAIATRWRARATLTAAFALATATADGAAGVCVRRSQRRAVRHTFTHTNSQARLTRRAEMRAIMAHAQVLVAAAAAARSVERDAAPSTALMMVSVCAPHLVPCPASREMPPFAARVRPLQADEGAGFSVAASSTALVAVGAAAAAPKVRATLVQSRPCRTNPRTGPQKLNPLRTRARAGPR